MNNTRYEDFCNRMRVYRKRLGYNQADIGKELGISQNDYSKRENGLIMISYDNLKKLQEIGMDIDELVSGKRDDIDTKDLDELISDCPPIIFPRTVPSSRVIGIPKSTNPA